MVRSYFTLNAVHTVITLSTFGKSKTMFKRVFTRKPVSAWLQEGSLVPGKYTKGCLPFLISSFCISWKGWQKSFDSQGGCQLSMAGCWRSREEPRMWLWALSAVELAACDRSGKATKAWPSKNTYFALQVCPVKFNGQEPRLFCVKYPINIWMSIWRFLAYIQDLLSADLF